MPLKDALRRALDEDDAEEMRDKARKERDELAERLAALEAKTTPDQDELDALQAELEKQNAEVVRLQTELDKHAAPVVEPPVVEPKTRPGRKSGSAYDWDVDDDGRVHKLDVARVYSGEDEADEVDLPADEPAAE